jgi:hypothetical protein
MAMISMWKFEETVYQTRALLEVMQDGLSNDVVGINQDFYATTIRTACNLLEGLQQMIEEDFRQAREEKKIGEYAEDNTDGEDEVPGWRAKSDLFTGEIVSDEEPESGEEREEGTAYLATGSLGVKLVEEHDDGSATFEVHGDKDQMGKLFSAFFTEAITRGIDCAEQSTQRWVLEKQIVKKAREFADLMMQWEWAEELDYDPQIRKVRVELTDLFIKYGAER